MKRNKRKIMPYLFISPFFILYAIFGLYPAVSGLILSLQTKPDSLHFPIIRQCLWTPGSGSL